MKPKPKTNSQCKLGVFCFTGFVGLSKKFYFRNMKPILFLFLFATQFTYSQVVWTKDPQNPVLRRDTVLANLPNDLIAISDPWVLKENNVYKMWYTAGGINYPTDTELRSRICYATSTDGLNWVKYAGNPVLDVDYSGGWDSLGVETVTVIIDPAAPANERYKMWYAGQYFNTYRYDIGYAYSPDGINWQKHPSPVLQVGASNEWDNGFLEGPSVIFDGTTYKMWYCGYDATVDGSGTDGQANIGYAESSDGITWVKSLQNPIMTASAGEWDAIYVQDPHVLYDGVYHMWYGGNDVDGYGQQVGYATSNDGILWTKSASNPVLTKGGAGEWDRNTASFPSVYFENGLYQMWYTGKDIEPMPNDLNYFWEVGYAEGTFGGLSSIDVSQVQVFPNPSAGSITFTLPAEIASGYVRILDALGNTVLTSAVYAGIDNKIDLTSFAAGCYIWKFENQTVLNSGVLFVNR